MRASVSSSGHFPAVAVIAVLTSSGTYPSHMSSCLLSVGENPALYVDDFSGDDIAGGGIHIMYHPAYLVRLSGTPHGNESVKRGSVEALSLEPAHTDSIDVDSLSDQLYSQRPRQGYQPRLGCGISTGLGDAPLGHSRNQVNYLPFALRQHLRNCGLAGKESAAQVAVKNLSPFLRRDFRHRLGKGRLLGVH